MSPQSGCRFRGGLLWEAILAVCFFDFLCLEHEDWPCFAILLALMKDLKVSPDVLDCVLLAIGELGLAPIDELRLQRGLPPAVELLRRRLDDQAEILADVRLVRESGLSRQHLVLRPQRLLQTSNALSWLDAGASEDGGNLVGKVRLVHSA